MRYTEKQKTEFKARFRQTQRYQVALIVPVGGAVAVLVFGERYAAHLGLQSLLLGATFLLVVAAGFSWLSWRCPACREFLGWSLRPTQCPACNLELRS